MENKGVLGFTNNIQTFLDCLGFFLGKCKNSLVCSFAFLQKQRSHISPRFEARGKYNKYYKARNTIFDESLFTLWSISSLRYYYDKYIFSFNTCTINWEKLDPGGTQTHISCILGRGLNLQDHFEFWLGEHFL